MSEINLQLFVWDFLHILLRHLLRCRTFIKFARVVVFPYNFIVVVATDLLVYARCYFAQSGWCITILLYTLVVVLHAWLLLLLLLDVVAFKQLKIKLIIARVVSKALRTSASLLAFLLLLAVSASAFQSFRSKVRIILASFHAHIFLRSPFIALQYICTSPPPSRLFTLRTLLWICATVRANNDHACI